jgi:4-diphosphocytidyl-2C-methyl-D-erythritol kinase
VAVMKKQLKDASDQQGKGEGKLQSVTSNLRNVQEEKARLQAACGQKEAQMTALVIALLLPTLIPLSGVGTTCFSSCCDKDTAIIFTTGRLPDVNSP